MKNQKNYLRDDRMKQKFGEIKNVRPPLFKKELLKPKGKEQLLKKIINTISSLNTDFSTKRDLLKIITDINKKQYPETINSMNLFLKIISLKKFISNATIITPILKTMVENTGIFLEQNLSVFLKFLKFCNINNNLKILKNYKNIIKEYKANFYVWLEFLMENKKKGTFKDISFLFDKKHELTEKLLKKINL